MSDPRDMFIARVVQGRSFADIGGLWGTVNEKVSVAARAGARREALTMIDISVADSPLWSMFRERLRDQGVDACREIIADISLHRGERHDVTHCSGVLYHHPNPMMILAGLRRATSRHLILSSAVTQERIENERGVYAVPRSGAVYVPSLDERERAVLATYWNAVGADIHGITRTTEYRVRDDNTFDEQAWWWLPTPDCMAAMAQSAGFRLLDRASLWNDNAHCLLLEAT